MHVRRKGVRRKRSFKKGLTAFGNPLLPGVPLPPRLPGCDVFFSCLSAGGSACDCCVGRQGPRTPDARIWAGWYAVGAGDAGGLGGCGSGV